MESTDNKPFFVIESEPIVEWPVTVNLPVAGGTFGKFQFSVSMRVLAPAEYETLFKSVPDFKAVKPAEGEDVQIPPMSKVLSGNVPIFQKLITGWAGVKDRDGKDVDFTQEQLAEQITGPRGAALSSGLWRAINEVRFGTHLEDGTFKDGVRQGN